MRIEEFLNFFARVERQRLARHLLRRLLLDGTDQFLQERDLHGRG